MTPAAWLKRERVRAACRLLLDTEQRVVDVGHAVGFESESAFHRQFLGVTRMTPGAYRALNGASVFMLQLPTVYRAEEILAYHSRDPASPCERVAGSRIYKALAANRGAVVLEIEIESRAAWCRVHSSSKLEHDEIAGVHAAALRMLGLTTDVATFEARGARDPRIAELLGKRRGLHLPLTPTVFDGLCWAIIGQQINIAFASALRREILELAGEPVGDMRAHPSAARLAQLDVADLATRRFSHAKAEYLIGAAQHVADGRLPIESLSHGSAADAERALRGMRGVGPWTARYTLMRGAGFADCAPIGDVALAAALQRLTGAAERPGPQEAEALMRPFAPYRSLATFHLWTSLKDAA
jgi:AraC family transcriptional regulator of adaptative response / DNA-3-methyladenine glycosylase II